MGEHAKEKGVEGKELEVVSSTKLLMRNQSLFCKKDALQIRVFLA